MKQPLIMLMLGFSFAFQSLAFANPNHEDMSTEISFDDSDDILATNTTYTIPENGVVEQINFQKVTNYFITMKDKYIGSEVIYLDGRKTKPGEWDDETTKRNLDKHPDLRKVFDSKFIEELYKPDQPEDKEPAKTVETNENVDDSATDDNSNEVETTKNVNDHPESNDSSDGLSATEEVIPKLEDQNASDPPNNNKVTKRNIKRS